MMEVAGQRGKNVKLCNLCDDFDITTFADGYCVECEVYICNSCFVKHKGRRVNRDHSLVKVEEAKSTKTEVVDTYEACKLHREKFLEIYCSKHDQFCCGECSVLNHNGCTLELVRFMANEFSNSQYFINLTEGIAKCSKQAEESIALIKANERKLPDLHEQFERDVNSCADEIIEKVNIMKMTLLDQANGIMLKDKKKMKEIKKETEELIAELSGQNELLESKKDQPNKLFAASVIVKPDLEKLQKRLDSLKADNSFTQYSFARDQSLERALKESQTIGLLHNHSEPEHPEESRNKDETTNVFVPSKKQPALDRQLPYRNISVDGETSSDWSPNDLEIFQHPMCLISSVNETNVDGEKPGTLFKIEERTIEQIRQITWPMVVVAVVGLCRTGKSYLMNHLAGATKGFPLSDGIEPKTNGIWAWCKIHPERPKTVLLLLDTEGLCDIEKDPSHDNEIFTLATLLCNCLVYNMNGAFDNDAVAQLSEFVSKMARSIRFRGEASDDNQYVALIIPDFVLCLRDFMFKLKKGNRELTENEYLEGCLALAKRKSETYNKRRECIKKYFPKRDCFIFPVPCDNHGLKNLESLGFDELSNGFKEAINRFVLYIYSKSTKVLLASKPVNGRMFVTLVDSYVRAMEHEAVLDVDDAFRIVAKVENGKIEKEAIEIFETEMKHIKLPIPMKGLRFSYTKAQTTALRYLRENVMHDKNALYEQQAMDKMDAVFTQVVKDNGEKIREMCEKKLQSLTKDFEIKIQIKEYEKPGGYKKFQGDSQMIKKEYYSSLRDFDEYEISWTWLEFVNTRMKDSEMKIIEADENLS